MPKAKKKTGRHVHRWVIPSADDQSETHCEICDQTRKAYDEANWRRIDQAIEDARTFTPATIIAALIIDLGYGVDDWRARAAALRQRLPQPLLIDIENELDSLLAGFYKKKGFNTRLLRLARRLR